jgi:hypothetical protein
MYKLWSSSLQSFLQLPIISTIFGPNYFLYEKVHLWLKKERIFLWANMAKNRNLTSSFSQSLPRQFK